MPRSKCSICDHDFDPKHPDARAGKFCSSRCAAVDQMYTDQGTYRVCFKCDVTFRALEPHHRLCSDCAQSLTGKPRVPTEFCRRDIDGRVMRE